MAADAARAKIDCSHKEMPSDSCCVAAGGLGLSGVSQTRIQESLFLGYHIGEAGDNRIA